MATHLDDLESLTITTPTAGAAIDCGRTGLVAVSIADANGGAVPDTLYSADAGELAAGVIHLADPLSLTGHPAPWTLTHSKRIALPNGLIWADRFEWRGGLSVVETPSFDGTGQVVEEYQRTEGRSIRLEPPDPSIGAMSYATVTALDAWQSTPQKRMALTYDGETFIVHWADDGLQPRPALGFTNYADDERWVVSFHFFTVG